MHAKSIKHLKKWEVSYWRYIFFQFWNCNPWFYCRHIGWNDLFDAELWQCILNTSEDINVKNCDGTIYIFSRVRKLQ